MRVFALEVPVPVKGGHLPEEPARAESRTQHLRANNEPLLLTETKQ